LVKYGQDQRFWDKKWKRKNEKEKKKKKGKGKLMVAHKTFDAAFVQSIC
jgi:hypothetical protein